MEINFNKNITLNQLVEIGYSIVYNQDRNFYLIRCKDTYLYVNIYDIKKDNTDFDLPIVTFEYKPQCGGDEETVKEMIRDISIYFDSKFLIDEDEEEYTYSCRELLDKLTEHSMGEFGLYLTKSGTICKDKSQQEKRQQEEDEAMAAQMKDNQKKVGDDGLPF